MTERDELERRLERLGRTPAPQPDPTFADDLEWRLRTGAVGTPGTGVAGGDPRSDRLGRRAGLSLAAAALVLLALAAAAVGFRGSTGDLSILDRSPDPTPPTNTDPAEPEPGIEPTTTTAQERTPPPTEPHPPRTTTTTAPTREGEPQETIRISAIERDGVVLLRWSRVDHPDFAAYLVLRADAPGEPDYPPNEATERVALVRDRDATQLRDRHESPTQPVYRIVAVDRFGQELARSPAISPAVESEPTNDGR